MIHFDHSHLPNFYILLYALHDERMLHVGLRHVCNLFLNVFHINVYSFIAHMSLYGKNLGTQLRGMTCLPRFHSILSYSYKASQMTWRVFSMGHCKLLKTRSFCCRQMIHARPRLKKNQIRLKPSSVLHKGRSNKHCNIEKDFHGPRFPFLAKSCQMMLATYRHPCWARGHL